MAVNNIDSLNSNLANAHNVTAKENEYVQEAEVDGIEILVDLAKHGKIDPWCGFVDYLNSGLTRFKELFLDEDEQQTVKLIFKKTVIPHSNMDTCKKLKIEHPEFIV